MNGDIAKQSINFKFQMYKFLSKKRLHHRQTNFHDFSTFNIILTRSSVSKVVLTMLAVDRIVTLTDLWQMSFDRFCRYRQNVHDGKKSRGQSESALAEWLHWYDNCIFRNTPANLKLVIFFIKYTCYCYQKEIWNSYKIIFHKKIHVSI